MEYLTWREAFPQDFEEQDDDDDKAVLSANQKKSLNQDTKHGSEE